MNRILGTDPKGWIVLNAIQTPDGTILHSKNLYDYKTHKDKNGKEYMVDGGMSYLRRNAHNDYKELSKYYTDLTHEEVIDILEWGNAYDKDMKRLPKVNFIKIKDMTTDHIQAILDGNFCHNPMYLKVFKDELERRSNA